MNQPENLYTPNCIRTHSGIYINPFDPTPDQIRIEDIAHSLSMQCRFAGHLPVHYSVAQHSVECSYLVPQENALDALLHDAPEAYLLDIPSPIKKLLPAYQSAENNILSMISDKFGSTYPLPEVVKWADKRMLEFEWEFIMLGISVMTILKFPSGNDFQFWTGDLAKNKFMTRFHQLISLKPLRYF